MKKIIKFNVENIYLKFYKFYEYSFLIYIKLIKYRIIENTITIFNKY